MQFRLSLIFGTLAASTLAFGQLGANVTSTIPYTDSYQVGYAANLIVTNTPGMYGDSVLNLSNSGYQGPFLDYPGYPITFSPNSGPGNICVNVYVMDPQEEEVACCSCLVTPNALIGLSARQDLINDTLTVATPTSIVIKLIASQPGPTGGGTTTAGPYTVCNAAALPIPTTGTGAAAVPYSGSNTVTATPTGSLAGGMIAWGTTIEPTIGWTGAGDLIAIHYAVVPVDYKKEVLSTAELSALVATCNFIQTDGSSYGICGSRTAGLSMAGLTGPCAPGGQVGALSGAKN